MSWEAFRTELLRRQNQPLTPGQKVIADLANPYQTQLQATSIWIALATSIGTIVVIGIFFSFVRPHNSVIYAPKLKYADKTHAPPPIGKGLFDWIKPIRETKEQELVDKLGLDAVVFLRFTRMCRNMFLLLSVFGCCILIPVHLLTRNQAIAVDNASPSSQAFNFMTPQYVQGLPMWSHVVVAYIFNCIILYFLWTNWKVIVRLRLNYFQSEEYQKSLHARSIWLYDIPAKDRSDEGILRIADKIKPMPLPRAAIGRNVGILQDLIEEHEEAVRKLESVLAKYLKNPDRLPAARPLLRPSKKDRHANHGAKLDAIDYLTARIRDLEIQIKDLRQTAEKRIAMAFGFATYDNIEEAHAVAYAARNKHPKGVNVKLAPKPSDMIWKNVSLSKSTRKGKRFMMSLWIGLLTVIWIAPNALIAIFLANLSNLADVWPAFRTSFDGNPSGWAVVQAIASPGLLSLIYLLLPIIFRRLSIRSGDLTKTSREKHVTHKLYSFFMFNNLIVFSIFSAVWKFVSSVISPQNHQSPWDVIKTTDFAQSVMVTLCTVSPFWVTWLLQRNLGAAADLSQIWNLIWVWFMRTFMAPTPRQTIQWTAPPWFDYASYYNYFLFYVTVTLCYATLQPIVLPVTCLYFAIDAWLKKYLLLYVFITKNESGGQFWNLVTNRMLFATGFANFVQMVVVKGAVGSWTMIGCMLPLFVMVIGFKIYTMHTFEDQAKYYHKATLKDPEAMGAATGKLRRSDKFMVKFGHPALYKPLITPMVHAKAQRALAEIYRGRLSSDADPTVGYTDIAMHDMSDREPGKSAHTGPLDGSLSHQNPANMFEVVPEAKLDFEYFKNRPDFKDHGGGGDLYGHASDLISERSSTPLSFFSNGPSRTGSPAPGTMTRIGRKEVPSHMFHDGGFGDVGQQDLYHLRNDSQRGLLGSSQPPGYTSLHPTSGEEIGHEQYGLESWRPAIGGSGYMNVPGHIPDDEPLDYEAYRRGGR